MIFIFLSFLGVARAQRVLGLRPCPLVGEAGPRASASPLVGGARLWGLWPQGPVSPAVGISLPVGRASVETAGCGTLGDSRPSFRSWALWWTGLGPGAAVGSRGLKEAHLLVGGALSLPSQLLGLRYPSTGACRLVGEARSWC